MDISVNALVAQVKSNAVEVPGSASLALPTAAPDDSATARFAAIMKSSEVDKAGPSQSATIPAREPAASHTSLGDRMLASLQGTSEGFKNVWSQTQARLQSDTSLQMQEMLAMQMQIAQMSVGYEVIGKGVSRITQNVDQLVRVQ